MPAISVENLSKSYRIGLKEEIPDTLAGAVTSWAKAPLRNFRRLRRLNTFRPQRPPLAASNSPLAAEDDSPLATDEDTIWALRDVSFEVEEGEVVGVIGRNGAGKSTLLKILSRITEPTAGRAVTRGRVSSLLEVGTGFHPELTGRENVYMNGTILGMTKREIDRKFDEIVDFSGVEKFLDTPVKRYSSGMKVRLAFAVAAHLEPEILIIDEVLAVGDAEFQKRCLGKMQDVARGGRTVLFVSHNMVAVENLCQRALILETGRVTLDGSVHDAIALYLQKLQPESTEADLLQAPRSAGLTPTIASVELLNADGKCVSCIQAMTSVTIRICYKHSSQLSLPRFGIKFETETGQSLFFLQTDVQHGQFPDLSPHGAVLCHVPQLPLVPGRYFLTIGCASRRIQLDKLERVRHFDIVPRDVFGSGSLPPRTHGAFLVNASWTAEPAARSHDHKGERKSASSFAHVPPSFCTAYHQ